MIDQLIIDKNKNKEIQTSDRPASGKKINESKWYERQQNLNQLNNIYRRLDRRKEYKILHKLYIFVETVMRTGFPFPFLTTESVGPMIAEHGSEWAKEEIATKILKGELIFGIGYSEPNSGTDLASLQTKAIKQSDGYLINGQKMWTSLWA